MAPVRCTSRVSSITNTTNQMAEVMSSSTGVDAGMYEGPDQQRHGRDEQRRAGEPAGAGPSAGLEVADPAERDHAGTLLGIGVAGQQLGPHGQLDVVPDHDRPSRSVVEPAAQR